MVTKLDILGKEQYRKVVCSNCGDKIAMGCEETDEDIEYCFEAGLEYE